MKSNKKIFVIGLILISTLYLFVRLYRLNDLIGFRLDQGIHLLETKNMVDNKKIRLIGPMVTSKSFEGRNFFIGANYYYVLGIVGLISQWNPLTITTIFIFLEFIFYIFFIFFLKRKFDSFWALLIFIFIAVSPYLINHSRFFWNPHLLVPLSILVLLFSEKYFFKKQIRYLFLMSFIWGFAFACHYSAIFWGLFFVFILVKSEQYLKIKFYLTVILGFILGNLPFFIFEIRHSFYNIKTLIYVFTHSSTSGEVTSHYFIFPLLIFVITAVLFLISNFKNKTKSNIFLIILFSTLSLIQIKLFSAYVPLDIIDGWNYSEQNLVADLIIKNGCPENFEVAATVQGDTRAYDLRFLLNLRKCEPMEVENYPKAEKLFLIAPVNRPPEMETVWEVISFGKFKINQKIDLGSDIIFYHLEKTN